MSFRYWAAVGKEDGHIRDVKKAASRDDAESILFDGWTDRLKSLYEVRPVLVTVDEAAESEPARPVGSL